MIGKIIAAIAGAQAAKNTSKVSETGGAVMGALTLAAVQRLKLPALLALLAGGYAVKKLSDKGDKPAPVVEPAPAKTTSKKSTAGKSKPASTAAAPATV